MRAHIRVNTQVVYVAPLKALVRERMDNWEKRLVPNTGKKLVELTGETAPDIRVSVSVCLFLGV